MHAVLTALTDRPLAVLLVISTLVFILRATYLLFLSPLSKIPGPWYTAVSDLWVTYHSLRLDKCNAVHELLEKYGPVVRVGPNIVAFRDSLSAKTVYMNPTFEKSVYYKSLQMFAVFSLTLGSVLTLLRRNDTDHAYAS
jgi:hypothetical protein